MCHKQKSSQSPLGSFLKQRAKCFFLQDNFCFDFAVSKLWHSFVGHDSHGAPTERVRSAWGNLLLPHRHFPQLSMSAGHTLLISAFGTFVTAGPPFNKRQTVLNRTSVEQERHGLLLWYIHSQRSRRTDLNLEWMWLWSAVRIWSRIRQSQSRMRARQNSWSQHEWVSPYRDVESLKTDRIFFFSFFFLLCMLNVASRRITGAGSVCRI